jgi:hypothetical protein
MMEDVADDVTGDVTGDVTWGDFVSAMTTAGARSSAAAMEAPKALRTAIWRGAQSCDCIKPL